MIDATCGSGAFLTKAMSNMIEEAGGVDTNKAKDIKANRLFGIEFDREIYALACANMLIHKDGKTNLERLDTTSIEAGSWISSKPITKVLMNPPFERKYKCMDIVLNVLNNVRKGTMTAFILPDKKLEKESKKKVKELLASNRIKLIVKLPEKLFSEGVTTSIFVIEAGLPQDDWKIISYNIEDDGLETVKNQGRQDIKNKWAEIENYWIEAIRIGEDTKYGTKQILDPKKHLSWQTPQKPFEIFEEDFKKTIMDFILFEKEVDTKEFNEKLLNEVLYKSNYKDGKLVLDLGDENEKN